MRAASDPFGVLAPLVAATGSTLTPEAFHARINVVFHDAEAEHYDTLHDDLWKSLPRPLGALADDVLADEVLESGVPSEPRLLDIGCGTGLATTLLLETDLGRRIASVDAIDTSPVMLERAAARGARWRPRSRFHRATADRAPDGPFDIVLTCSVLHHIPDLADFLTAVSIRQPPGGYFIHLQDPNAEVIDTESIPPSNVAARFALGESAIERRRRRSRRARFTPARLMRAAIRRLRHDGNGIGGIGGAGYIDTINRRLLADGVIARPMTSEELWSVTDIHCADLPYSHGRGIAKDDIGALLSGYTNVSHRTYGFFGPLESELPDDLAARERTLAAEGDLHGRQLAAVWRKDRSRDGAP